MMTKSCGQSPFADARFGGLLTLMAIAGAGVVTSSDNTIYSKSLHSSQPQDFMRGTVALLFEDAFAHQEHSSSEDVLELAGYPFDGSDSSEAVPDVLNRLLSESNLSKKLLSEILGVARPTLYSWLKGGAIADENYDRLVVISELVSLIDDSHRLALSKLFKMFAPDSGGKKFLDLFSEAVKTGDKDHFFSSYVEVKEKLDKRVRVEERISRNSDSEIATNQASSFI
ncbi:hypothetical protein [uncultured Marinobacter sp.]|uniref:hypothetical protein n=1 Tax=uncultured Marinobacter sp. TaxID=187379 RepID=UPI0025920AB9|nr:hypothetical protein [uncultured Marinobacter sp.]